MWCGPPRLGSNWELPSLLQLGTGPRLSQRNRAEAAGITLTLWLALAAPLKQRQSFPIVNVTSLLLRAAARASAAPQSTGLLPLHNTQFHHRATSAPTPQH